MFALHGVWRADHRLALWAEDAARPAAPPDAQSGLHPFACPPAALRALLSAVSPGLAWLTEQAAEDDTRLLLPTAEGAPLPSPEITFPSAHERRSAARLTPWRVPSLLFTPGQAAQLLGALHAPDRQAVHPDLPGLGPVEAAYGSSLRWLTALHDLAWRLVGRGRVLPAITLPRTTAGPDAGRPSGGGLPGASGHDDRTTPLRGGGLPGAGAPDSRSPDAAPRSGGLPDAPTLGDYLPAPAPGSGRSAYARWVAAPQAADGEELAGLVAACPAACRAEAGARRAAAALAEDVLGALVDEEARARLAGSDAAGGPPGTTGTDGAAGADGPGPDGTDGSGAGEPTTVLLAALSAEDGALPGPAARWRSLAERLRAWRAPSEGASGGRLRLGFRLVEPLGDTREEDEDRWWLELLLSPADEPSHVVTAEDLWAGRAGAAVLAETVPSPEGAFVLEVRRAARTHPLLAVLAEEGRPQGRWFDRAEALAFLREAAPALADAGFEVLLPSWWREPPSLGLLLAARPAQAGVVEQESTVGREELLAFQWQLALGGEPLTAEELALLTAAKDTLVQLRGRWLVADRERLAAAAAFLSREGSGEMAVSEVLGLMLDAREPAGLPVLAVEVGGRLRGLVARLSGTASSPGAGGPSDAGAPPAALALPEGFRAELRPYQHDGAAWLAELTRLGLGGVLADDMGLGKTVQTLALLAAEYAGTAPPGAPTLVVVPMSLLGNWERECARFAPMLRVHVHHGAQRGGGARVRQAAVASDVVLTTYGLAARDFEALSPITWHRIVADEAQYLKNAATLQSRAVRALSAGHRIALTGTPVENRLADLHSLLDFVNPGLFGTTEQFKERYAVAIERNASERATALLRRRTEPFVLRRVKTDPAIAAELPRKQEMTVLCNLTVEQAALYRAVVTRLLQRIKGMGYTRDLERRGSVLAALTRLKQICDHPALFTGEGARGGAVRLAGRSGKVALLEEILEGALSEGDSTLCFTQYAQFGRLLQPYLRRRLGCRVRFLHGGVSEPERRVLVDSFQEDDEPSVFLLSLRAGGTGLNLTAANQVVHLDRWWNPAVEEQATDRAYRIGQRRDVQVRRLVSVGTVEERVDELLTAKRALADAVIGGGLPADAGVLEVLTALSPDALANVLALAEEAVSEL
ncbi:SNF2-related protein [Streptacidiphilus jiangxiensis]|uniref:Superfamily II DNA or RNA helicase, SNF2 family n=2 Tax=Streptacidiphilus jiangxiensis TaxID=235985 RepID=A0A1H7HUJ1_STRJI|nr:SNF2-related protein [Streptacidiphilus jiangxiensis]SEK53939.1 Superfamily II DNA or RNA helicase, SNF2 family [Streptacidiphilus jiangxiensis]